jgi:hypothetical protein
VRTTACVIVVLSSFAVARSAVGVLPVAYDADLKTLRKDLRFGDPLGFSLFTTPDCSGEPAYSEILGAGTPAVTVEEVRPVAARKQKPKPAAVARIRAELAVEVVGAALHLRVEGPGVLAIGKACQAQVAAVVGSPGPPGPPGPSLQWIDHDGTVVGPVVDVSRVFLVELGGVAVINNTNPAFLRPDAGPPHYSTVDCSGTPVYQVAGASAGLVGAAGRWFVASPGATALTVQVQSFLASDGSCLPHSELWDAVPLVEIFPTGKGFTVPFALPLSMTTY